MSPTHSLSVLMRELSNQKRIPLRELLPLLPHISNQNQSLHPSQLNHCIKSLTHIISRCDNPQHLRQIHSQISPNILQNSYLNISLLKGYAHHSCLKEVWNVFHSHSISPCGTDQKMIKTMIRILIDHHHFEDALKLYDETHNVTDAATHILAIKACTKSNAFDRGNAIIQRSGMHSNSDHFPTKTALIEFYGTSGQIHNALALFSSIPSTQMNGYLLSAMMKALIQNERFKECLELYDQYYRSNVSIVDDVCHLLAIKASRCSNDYHRGREIHCRLRIDDNTKHRVELTNALIEFYGHFGEIQRAWNVFNALNPKTSNFRNFSTLISTMMKVLNLNKKSHQALTFYEQYLPFESRASSKKIDHQRNRDSIQIQALKACIDLCDEQYGRRIIRDSERNDSNRNRMDSVSSLRWKMAMIEFYGHFDDLNAVKTVFHSIGDNDQSPITISTTMKVLINGGYVNCNEALSIYWKFQNAHPLLMDDICHNLAISACIGCNDFETGKRVHRNIEHLKDRNVMLQNALISFYGHFRDFENSKTIFDGIPDDQKDIVTVSAMMKVYCNMQSYEDCIELFKAVQKAIIHERLVPDVVTFGIVLNACTQSTAYHYGREVHSELMDIENGRMLEDVSIQIQLIKMYSKCGDLNTAQRIFEDSKHRGNRIEIWNAMMNGFGRNGMMDRVKEMYTLMQKEKELRGDEETFRILFSACSHCGDVQWATDLWDTEMDVCMQKTPEVVNAFVDCLCRKGMLQKAKQVILDCNRDDEISWTSYLTAYLCKLSNGTAVCTDDIGNIYGHLKSFKDESDVLRLYRKLLDATQRQFK